MIVFTGRKRIMGKSFTTEDTEGTEEHGTERTRPVREADSPSSSVSSVVKLLDKPLSPISSYTMRLIGSARLACRVAAMTLLAITRAACAPISDVLDVKQIRSSRVPPPST